MTRRYKAADIQLDAVFNKEGWHFPQQRMLALWGDVQDTLAGKRAPEPLFFRANTGECIEYSLTNLVPNVYELDDFQVRTPTDILGQHIHLVKFDVTSSDGAANGFNYEDGTFSPDEVTERIRAINAGGGLRRQRRSAAAQRNQLTAKALPFFGPGPGGRWMGAQATIQRWYADPLFDGPRHDPPAAPRRRPHAAHGLHPRPLRAVDPPAGGPLRRPGDRAEGLALVRQREPGGGAVRRRRSEDRPADPRPHGHRRQRPARCATAAPPPGRRSSRPAESRASFREFVFAVQDTTLTYSIVRRRRWSIPFADQGWCSAGGGTCEPATLTKPATGCDARGLLRLRLLLQQPEAPSASWPPGRPPRTSPPAATAQATCNLVPGIPGQVVAYQPLNSSPAASQPMLADIATWGTLPIDAPNKVAAEVITQRAAAPTASR